MPERRPFDPSRIAPPESAHSAGGGGAALLSPRSVNELVRGALARQIPPTLRVLGEIGDITQPRSGHLYLSLKDNSSELSCVMWRSAAAKLKFSPEPGMEVVATGGLDVYTPRGTYQLIVRKLEPRGVGGLEIAFRQLKERLEREGLFDQARKKQLPKIPRRIAVVTSPTGAAIRDILRTLARRFPLVEILVYPVRVQGTGAAAEIAEAVRLLNQHATALQGIDAMIVGRGGGSLEDLWAFNEEVVARAIAASVIPVISAVGHEIDMSISDMVADVRAATPTAAAELIAPRLLDLTDQLDRNISRAMRAVGHATELARHRLDAVHAHERLARPLNRLREWGQLVDERERRLLESFRNLYRQTRERLSVGEVALLRYGPSARCAQASRDLERRGYRMSDLLHRRLLSEERSLHIIFTRLRQRHPSDRIARFGEHLRQLRLRAANSVHQSISHHQNILRARLDAVRACDPRRVLERGYSITRATRTRRILTSIEDIKDGMRISTELADGEFRGTADDPRQPGLFD